MSKKTVKHGEFCLCSWCGLGMIGGEKVIVKESEPYCSKTCVKESESLVSVQQQK